MKTPFEKSNLGTKNWKELVQRPGTFLFYILTTAYNDTKDVKPVHVFCEMFPMRVNISQTNKKRGFNNLGRKGDISP